MTMREVREPRKGVGGEVEAMARLCSEVFGPKTLELTTRFNAQLYYHLSQNHDETILHWMGGRVCQTLSQQVFETRWQLV